MAFYIKMNPTAARELGLTEQRMQTADGNYMGWQLDLVRIAPAHLFREAAAVIGAAVLTPEQAKAEQDGTACHELPIPTDPKYYTEEIIQRIHELQHEQELPIAEEEELPIEPAGDAPADEQEQEPASETEVEPAEESAVEGGDE